MCWFSSNAKIVKEIKAVLNTNNKLFYTFNFSETNIIIVADKAKISLQSSLDNAIVPRPHTPLSPAL